MRVVFLAVLIMGLLLMASAVIAEDEQTVSPSSLPGSINISGNVTDIDYSQGSFVLADGNDAYTIFAGNVRVRFNSGFGEFNGLKAKAYVTVFGDRISEKLVQARSIIVIDETGKFRNLRSQGYSPNADVDIDGQVIGVSTALNEFVIRAGTDTFVVAVGQMTEIKRTTFASNLSDMREGDQVNIVGNRAASDRINAIKVIINSAKSNLPIYDDGYYGHYELVQGTIITPASVYSRSIVVQTGASGLKTIEVPRGVDVIRTGRSISLHDLIRGEWVRAYGTWDFGQFEAVRVESTGSGSDHHHDDDHHGQNPGTDPPIYWQTRVGTISSIDIRKKEIKLDIGLTDMTVNASDAKVQRNGSTISFGSLEKGDKVQITGGYSAGFLKANLISLLAKAIDNKDKTKD